MGKFNSDFQCKDAKYWLNLKELYKLVAGTFDMLRANEFFAFFVTSCRGLSLKTRKRCYAFSGVSI